MIGLGTVRHASPARCAATSRPRTRAIPPRAASRSLEVLVAWPGVHALLRTASRMRSTTPRSRSRRACAYLARTVTGHRDPPARDDRRRPVHRPRHGRRDRRDGRDRRRRDDLPGGHARRHRLRDRQAPPDGQDDVTIGVGREAARPDRRRSRREDRRRRGRHPRRARRPRPWSATPATPCASRAAGPRARTPTGSISPTRSPTRSRRCRRGSPSSSAGSPRPRAGRPAAGRGGPPAAHRGAEPRRRLNMKRLLVLLLVLLAATPAAPALADQSSAVRGGRPVLRDSPVYVAPEADPGLTRQQVGVLESQHPRARHRAVLRRGARPRSDVDDPNAALGEDAARPGLGRRGHLRPRRGDGAARGQRPPARRPGRDRRGRDES